MQIGRFSTPLEDYSAAVRKIKTLDDVRTIEQKYQPFLDDAAPCFARIDELSFPEFKKQLRLCYREGSAPPDDWLERYGAIVLPKLFIDLVPLLKFNMGSGFAMNRLLDLGWAAFEDGRFVLHIPEAK